MSSPGDALNWIDALQSPAAYRHCVHDVQILQTHISWVVLTGQFAYKIKKPVDMGFLDFTTLEKRKFYCQEELRLNRRLVEDLYLQVVPITGSLQSPCVGGDGEAIEYAVQMRQFPQEALLSEVLAQGELSNEHLDALAVRIAEFHRQAASAPTDSSLGGLASLHHSLEEVFEHLEARSEEHASALRLRDWCRQQLAEHQVLAYRRHAAGFVRECHGDMHLGNMLLWHGKPAVFDCIEFNEEFRWIDVLSDVAFTTMDLEDRGAPQLAHRFLNAYLEQTGDYEGLPLLPYFLAFRALIRAKVASLRLEQPHLKADERSQQLSRHASYLELADRYAQRQLPLLIITHGVSGSGKTTLTQPLLEAIGAIRTRSDVERKRLFGLAAQARTRSAMNAGIYASDATEQTYAHLAELAGTVLRAGYTTIVDATFLRRDQRAVFQRLAVQLNVPFLILDIQASVELLRQRILRRATSASDASEANLAVLDWQLSTSEPLAESEPAIAIDMDNGNASPEMLSQIVEAIDRAAGTRLRRTAESLDWSYRSLPTLPD